MIMRASEFRMGVGRFPSPLRAVGLLAMPDAGLDTTRHIQSGCNVPPGAGVIQLLVAVGVFIDCHSVADVVETTR
jgi:hypothetical protein